MGRGTGAHRDSDVLDAESVVGVVVVVELVGEVVDIDIDVDIVVGVGVGSG